MSRVKAGGLTNDVRKKMEAQTVKFSQGGI